jgi:hypothetical protein
MVGRCWGIWIGALLVELEPARKGEMHVGVWKVLVVKEVVVVEHTKDWTSLGDHCHQLVDA